MNAAKILIVDDNPVNLKVLRALLSRSHYELVAADTGQAALDLTRANPSFDLILLDVVLPDISGIEVCRLLKNDPVTAHIPVVLISALRTDDRSISDGLETGADGYLTQPIDDVALQTWVKTVLRINRLQRELAARTSADSITDEELLRRFAKLAHAVNNPLQALYAGAELLALELENQPGARDLVAEIMQHAEKVAQLVGEASLIARSRLQARSG